MQKSVLGKGLSALINTDSNFSSEQILYLKPDEICLNPVQPRKIIEQEKIRELADSIKHYGVLQPLIVTKKEGLYHLVVGERRLRACRLLGIEEIPAIIKEFAWDDMLKVALVENLQRQDLNAIEEARAYKLLLVEHGLTQEQVSEAIGKSRPYVANIVRLLNLPQPIIDDVEAELLSPGHARALLGLEDENKIITIAEKIKNEGLSVRQTEKLVKSLKENLPRKTTVSKLLPFYRKLQDTLSTQFSTRVLVKKTKNQGGKIEIHFNSEEELGRLISIMGADEKWV
ncbi:MAG: ParB/RepB/Spo0J family partition protein [Vulcanimicrobiota bacterium]